MILLLMFAIGGFLRWYRLDLISFRYDIAEALIRARQTLEFGYPPMTGILNSLGFRNAPGFIWAILPPLLFTPDPRWATAWVGLLTLTGLFPLHRICREYISRWSFLIPCALYAVIPTYVLEGRNVWAQCLLPAMGAWCLLWLLRFHDQKIEIRSRWRFGMASLAMASAAASVHLSGMVYVVFVLVCIARKWKSGVPPRTVYLAIATGLLPAITLLPSVYDFAVNRVQQQDKPAHILKFESMLPPPKNLAGRLYDALGGQFAQFSSLSPLEGVADSLNKGLTRLLSVTDMLMLLLSFAGICIVILDIARSSSRNSTTVDPIMPKPIGTLLILWAVVPAAAGAVAIARVNATYFAFASLVLPLMAAAAIEACNRLLRIRAALKHTIYGVFSTAIISIYTLANLDAIAAISRLHIVPGNYYIPLTYQVGTAKQLADAGVAYNRLVHLSGEWYQRPYEYLLKEMTVPALKTGWGVIEDEMLRTTQHARCSFMAKHATLRHGTVSAVIFRDRTSAARFCNEYYSIPLTTPSAPGN